MRKSKHLHYMAGVTIIEMLLVVTIIGLLSVIGLSSFKLDVQDARVNKAVGQIQYIAHGLRNYRRVRLNDTLGWPTTFNGNSELHPYLPPYFVANPVGPWGNAYTIEPYPINSANAHMMRISTTLPDINTLKQVVSRTPSAYYRDGNQITAGCTNDCTVDVYVTVPLDIETKDEQRIVGINTVDNNNQSLFYSTNTDRYVCPNGSPAKYFYGINGVERPSPWYYWAAELYTWSTDTPTRIHVYATMCSAYLGRPRHMTNISDTAPKPAGMPEWEYMGFTEGFVLDENHENAPDPDDYYEGKGIAPFLGYDWDGKVGGYFPPPYNSGYKCEKLPWFRVTVIQYCDAN